MAKTLDRKKPFGTIHQSGDHDGRHFAQDGVYFDAKGEEWVAPATEAPPVVEPKPKAK